MNLSYMLSHKCLMSFTCLPACSLHQCAHSLALLQGCVRFSCSLHALTLQRGAWPACKINTKMPSLQTASLATVSTNASS